ncbi:MAG: putative alpha/beta hydrolase family esterase [Psychromonas sp.]|jgi:predicted alpha/beta hydrolase family esterase
MKLFPKDINIINVAGLGGSGREHWQTIWSHLNPTIINLEQDNWQHPKCKAWVDRLEEVVKQYNHQPIVLIGHSMAYSTIVHAAQQGKLNGVIGAFMVAPADLERKDFPVDVSSFLPTPIFPLPFTSMVVGSENDPYCSIEKAKKYSIHTESKFVNVGKKGHLTSSDGIERWEVGEQLFFDFLSLLDY